MADVPMLAMRVIEGTKTVQMQSFCALDEHLSVVLVRPRSFLRVRTELVLALVLFPMTGTTELRAIRCERLIALQAPHGLIPS
jgi:hypothetical protein